MRRERGERGFGPRWMVVRDGEDCVGGYEIGNGIQLLRIWEMAG